MMRAMTDEHQDDIEPYAICDCGRVFNTQKEYEDHTEWCDDYHYEKEIADREEIEYQRYQSYRGERE